MGGDESVDQDGGAGWGRTAAMLTSSLLSRRRAEPEGRGAADGGGDVRDGELR